VVERAAAAGSIGRLEEVESRYGPNMDATAGGTASSTVRLALEGDALRVQLAGEWKMRAHLPPTDEVERQLASPGLRRLLFDADGVSGWDTALLVFVVRIEAACRERGIEIDPGGLPEGVSELKRLAFAVPESKDTRKAGRPEPWLARLGTRSVAATAGVRDVLEFVGNAVLSLLRFVTGRARYRRSDLWLFVQECGVDALPIVSLISFLVGLILAFVGVQQLALFGAEIYVANLVGIAMAREMGCIMTGIIMAGRTGAAFAAQLGTMTVNEEIDALTTLGIPAMDFLVLPRMLALILMMPLLCLYADAVGILGGALIGVTGSDITMTQYFQQTQESLTLQQVGIGVAKASVFGVLVAMAGCLRGLQSGRSASAVGAAATSAVVLGIVWIIASDAIFAVALNALGI
jgi:phospholipid/cholesterol/gamma-HCH transport system permease protein